MLYISSLKWWLGLSTSIPDVGNEGELHIPLSAVLYVQEYIYGRMNESGHFSGAASNTELGAR